MTNVRAGNFPPQIEEGMPILEHLTELRRRLTWAFGTLIIGTIISFSFADRIFTFLIEPYGDHLRTHSPTEPLESFFKVSLVAGAILAMPVILYQLWLFVEPALHDHEKRYVYVFVPSAMILFLLGILFGWYILIPTAIHFLSAFMPDIFVSEWNSEEYISFTTTFLFWLGISFEMPIIVYLIARTGLISAQTLREQWRLAVVIIAVIAAAVTPTVDPLTMIMTMAPLLVLYVLSFGLARLGERQFANSADKSE